MVILNVPLGTIGGLIRAGQRPSGGVAVAIAGFGDNIFAGGTHTAEYVIGYLCVTHARHGGGSNPRIIRIITAKILTEEDETKKAGWIALLSLTKNVMIDCITVLGFEAPEKM